MDTRLAFLGHVLFYAAFPVYFASLHSSMRLVFLYAYIAIVLTVGGFLGAVYTLPLGDDVSISAGSVSYGALMFSALLLVVVGRNLQIIRNTVKIIVAVNVFKLGLFAITAGALGSALYPNPFDTQAEVFTVSIRSVVTGGLLIIVELLLMVAIFERIKTRYESPWLLSATYTAVFMGVLCLDGLLFPIAFDPGADDLGALITSGVQAKLALAAAFALPLVFFLVVLRPRMAQYESTPLRLHELFFMPTDDLIHQIGRQQRALETSEATYRQLTESVGEMLFAVDGELRIVAWNRAARERTGMPAERVAGCRPDEVWPELRDGEVMALYRRVIETGESETLLNEVEQGAMPGVFEISAFPFEDGASVLVRDVSAQRARERELERQAETANWMARIRTALDGDGFVLHAQPVVELATGRVEHHELLLRMADGDGGLILPNAFLPTAERFGLIAEIDGWVVAEGARIARRGTAVTINLSAASVGQPGMLDVIERAITESGADPGLIVFEITETALMGNLDAGELFTTQLVQMGFRVALDDFGTGFGSFTYLKRLPAHFLKIDIEFVGEALHNPRDRHVIGATVALADGFGQQTIGEGVENEETLRLLTSLGVTHAQGFHIGRPGPLPPT